MRGPPLPLWERPASHRRCDPGEGFVSANASLSIRICGGRRLIRRELRSRHLLPQGEKGSAAHCVSPNFSFSRGNSRSGLNGTSVKRIPVALAIALPSAAATGLYGLSLIDFAPIGPIVS